MKKHILVTVVFLMCLLAASGCSNATSSFQEGISQYQKGEYEAANKYFTQAISQGKRDGEAYASLGLTQLQLNQLENAQASINQALELAPTDASTLRIAGIYQLNRGDYEAAETYLSQSVSSPVDKMARGEYDSYGYLAEAKVGRGDYAGAVEIYTGLINAEFCVEELLIKRGVLYLDLNMETEALADFDRVSNLEEVSRYSLLRISDIFWDRREYSTSQGYKNRAFAEVTGTDGEKGEIARLYYLEGYYEQAIQMLLNMTEMDEDTTLLMAQCYLMQEKWSAAESRFDALLLTSENLGLIYNQYAISKILQGDFPSASRLISQGKTYDNDMTVNNALAWNDTVLSEHQSDFASAYEKLQNASKNVRLNAVERKELLFLKSR